MSELKAGDIGPDGLLHDPDGLIPATREELVPTVPEDATALEASIQNTAYQAARGIVDRNALHRENQRLDSALTETEESLRIQKGRSQELSGLVDELVHQHGALVEQHDELVERHLDEKVKVNEVRERAVRDELTKLYNRGGVFEEFEKLMSRQGSRRHDIPRSHAALFLDLDGFKELNDTLGHAAGDVALVETAEKLRQRTRYGDILGRMGGDEFVVILRNVTPEEAKKIAEDIRVAITSDTLGASIGIRNFAADDNRFEQIIHNADEAMYEAKRSGKGRIAVYKPELQDFQAN